MNMLTRNITDYLLLLILALIWSSSFMLIKVAVESVPPFTLTAARLAIAAIIFWAVLGIRGQTIPCNSSALLLYISVGLLGNSIPFVLISWGETRISSSLAAILMGIMPIATFILAHFFLAEERITPRRLYGISFGFSGLVILIGAGAVTSLYGEFFGQLAVLGGALCYAMATVTVRKLPGFAGYKMAAGINTTAAIISTALSFLLENPTQVKPSAGEVWSVIALGVFPTAIASLIYIRVVANLGATTFAQINYIIPVLGGLWGILLLEETLRWNVFVALGCILGGIYLLQSSQGRTTNR